MGAGYARDRGLGFSPAAAPSWDADALFREDKAGPRPSWDTQEQGLKEDKNRQECLRLLVEDVGKWWKTGQGLEGVQEGRKSCRRFGKGAGGLEKVQKAMGKCGRGGKAREVTVHYTQLPNM